MNMFQDADSFHIKDNWHSSWDDIYIIVTFHLQTLVELRIKFALWLIVCSLTLEELSGAQWNLVCKATVPPSFRWCCCLSGHTHFTIASVLPPLMRRTCAACACWAPLNGSMSSSRPADRLTWNNQRSACNMMTGRKGIIYAQDGGNSDFFVLRFCLTYRLPPSWWRLLELQPK